MHNICAHANKSNVRENAIIELGWCAALIWDQYSKWTVPHWAAGAIACGVVGGGGVVENQGYRLYHQCTYNNYRAANSVFI